eukprot:1218973-Prymnesium_polylepis.1
MRRDAQGGDGMCGDMRDVTTVRVEARYLGLQQVEGGAVALLGVKPILGLVEQRVQLPHWSRVREP